MKLEVYPNKNRKGKLLFAQILCLAAAAAIVWLLNLGFIKDRLREERWGFWLFVGFLSLFLLLFAACFYFRNRPRIRVSGQSVTFYPLLTPAKQVTWAEITARQVNLDCTGDPKATAATVAGGVIGYAIYQSLQQSSLDSAQELSPDRDWKFTYYQGGKKLISILSRESEHALEFDEMVRAHLAGAPMPAMQAGGESAAPEQKPGQGPRGHRLRPAGRLRAGGVGHVPVPAKQAAAAPPLGGSAPGKPPPRPAGGERRSSDGHLQKRHLCNRPGLVRLRRL